MEEKWILLSVLALEGDDALDLDGRADVSGFAFFSPSAPGTHSCGACTVPAERVFPL